MLVLVASLVAGCSGAAGDDDAGAGGDGGADASQGGADGSLDAMVVADAAAPDATPADAAPPDPCRLSYRDGAGRPVRALGRGLAACPDRGGSIEWQGADGTGGTYARWRGNDKARVDRI